MIFYNIIHLKNQHKSNSYNNNLINKKLVVYQITPRKTSIKIITICNQDNLQQPLQSQDFNYHPRIHNRITINLIEKSINSHNNNNMDQIKKPIKYRRILINSKLREDKKFLIT